MLVDIEVDVLILLELDMIKLDELVTDSLRVDKLVEVEATANQATTPAMQPPSAPYRRNSAQVADVMNQNMPSYQNQPAQQTVQQDTFRMDNLAHLATTAY